MTLVYVLGYVALVVAAVFGYEVYVKPEVIKLKAKLKEKL
jgi:hypothetical protein